MAVNIVERLGVEREPAIAALPFHLLDCFVPKTRALGRRLLFSPARARD
jgi:hypothetical protein